MAQVFIVEDEFIIAQHLRTIVAELGHEVVATASSATEALRQLATLPAPPDLFLLDIMLQGELDGIDLASRLRAEHGLPFVFITSLTTPATVARAKATRPLGYLVKPFDAQEVFVALEMALTAADVTPAARAAVPTPPTPATSIFVRDGKRLERVDYADINWLESDGNYTLLHTQDGHRYAVAMALKTVEQQLPEALFQRVHKSYVVALARIEALEGQSVLIGGTSIPVGRVYNAALLNRLHLLDGHSPKSLSLDDEIPTAEPAE